MIPTSNRQIIFIYHSEKNVDRQTLAYAKSNHLKIREVDLAKETFTPTMLLELTNKVNLPLRDLIDKDHEDIRNKAQLGDWEDDDLLKIIERDFTVLKTPIAMLGDNILVLETPTDILKL